MCCPCKRLINKGTPRDLADVTLGTLASPIRSDRQDMRENLCLDPTNNTSDFVVFRLNRFP